MAFLSKVTQNGVTKWKVVWVDETKGAGKAGRRWADCVSGKHKAAFDAAELSEAEREALALGATNGTLREKLRKCYDSLEASCAQDAARSGGVGKGTRFETGLLELAHAFLEDMKLDVEVRQHRGGRAGVAAGTHKGYADAIGKLRKYLAYAKLTPIKTGELTADHLKNFRAWLTRTKSERGGKTLSPSSVNSHLRHIKGFLGRYLDDGDMRPYFRATEASLRKALKAVAEDRSLPERFTPTQLKTLVEKAIEMDSRGTMEVERKKKKFDKVERYEQRMAYSPVLPWLLVLMLTGCRVHEAAKLKWSDIDFDHGTIIFRSQKTGRERLLMLNDPHGPISPGLLALLKHWRNADTDAEFVLPPTGKEDQPVMPKRPWAQLCRLAKVQVKPKSLRSNWVSYMASMGRPATTVALYAGHSPVVLEKHYLALAHARLAGNSLDETMGIADLFEAAATAQPPATE